MAHKDRFYGGRALIVLGGPSGKDWKSVFDEIQPNVLMTANGNTGLPGVEYWMLAENMHYQQGQAQQHGTQRGKEFMKIVEGPNTAHYRLISHRSWDLFNDHTNCIRIRRTGYELTQIPDDFSLRDYGEGYLNGWMFRHVAANQANVNYHVGTVGLHLLHHAGILGCSEVHTIGYDLMFKGETHHWYKYPPYQPDRFTNANMFVCCRYGDVQVPTRWVWIETAKYLRAIEYLFERDNLEWIDHSNGLLSYEGLWCTRSVSR